MKQMLRLAGIAILFFATPVLAETVSLTCDQGTVEMSDSKYEIAHKCGEPTFKDFSKVTRITKTSDEEVIQAFVTVEDWLYNFGPGRFVVVLSFENDKLVGMRSFGYGRADGESPDFNKSVEIGDPTVRLLFLYGPPSYKEERIDTSVTSRENGLTIPVQKTITTWTYNRGPGRLMRIYHFVNGRLHKIEVGDRGF